MLSESQRKQARDLQSGCGYCEYEESDGGLERYCCQCTLDIFLFLREIAAQDTGESDTGADRARRQPEGSQVAHQHESGGVEGNAATCAGRHGNGGASALRTAHSEPETQAGLAGIKPCPLSPQWIRVRDRLPKDKQMVLLIGINFGPHENYTTDMYCGWFFDERWHRWPHWPDPTHWMPLPPAPDEE